ncbi:WD repeat-containing protein 82 [Syncephalis fuscata]|nr:WD repeat-containing protein 82 [Syncephalis fuscata]
MAQSLTCTLTPRVLASLHVAKVHNEQKKMITSLDFFQSGDVCLTASQDDSLCLYDCHEGKVIKTLPSKKYGCHMARFTHHRNNVIHASTKSDDTIRYLSLHDNRYLRYFRGHKARVTALEMNPVNDTFLSASLDGTIRLWDLRSDNCQGVLHLDGTVAVGWDQGGEMFAAGKSGGDIRLYALESLDKGPFQVFPLHSFVGGNFDTPLRWTGLKFSNDGLSLLVATDGECHYILDAFTGVVKRRLSGHNAITNGSGDEVNFTPDGQYVIGGSEDGTVHIWQVNAAIDAPAIAQHEGHTGPVHAVGWNPKLAIMVTCSNETALWLPEWQALQESVKNKK